MTASDPARAIDAIWRIESAKLIAALTRMVRDIGLAEELAHDALVTALEQWPRSGIPDAPGAWLMATAKNRALDVLRRGQRLEGKHEELRHQMEARQMSPKDLDAAIDENVGDDLLRLMLIACHPILSREGRVALTLRLLGGLTGEEIARGSRSRAGPLSRSDCPRCWRSSTWCSTRATRQLLGKTGSDRGSARMRSGSGAFWPSSYRMKPRCAAWLR